MDESQSDSFRTLLSRSRSPRWQTRATTAAGLGQYPAAPEALERLAEMLDDPDEAVIGAAARALLTSSDPDGAWTLFRRLAAGAAGEPTSSDVEMYEVVQGEVTRMAAEGLAVRHTIDAVAHNSGLGVHIRATARSMAALLPGRMS